MKLVINRKKWSRGGIAALRKDGNHLRNEDGSKCCLGFFGTALGIKSNRLDDAGAPDEVNSHLWPEWLVVRVAGRVSAGEDMGACRALININDSTDVTLNEKDREKQIRDIFKRHGVKVVFK